MDHTTMSTHLKLPSRSLHPLALKEAAKTAQPAILEPMMLVTITVPEENLGDVMGHVTARRGRVDGMEAHGNSQIVRASFHLLKCSVMQQFFVLHHKDVVHS